MPWLLTRAPVTSMPARVITVSRTAPVTDRIRRHRRPEDRLRLTSLFEPCCSGPEGTWPLEASAWGLLGSFSCLARAGCRVASTLRRAVTATLVSRLGRRPGQSAGIARWRMRGRKVGVSWRGSVSPGSGGRILAPTWLMPAATTEERDREPPTALGHADAGYPRRNARMTGRLAARSSPFRGSPPGPLARAAFPASASKRPYRSPPGHPGSLTGATPPAETESGLIPPTAGPLNPLPVPPRDRRFSSTPPGGPHVPHHLCPHAVEPRQPRPHTGAHRHRLGSLCSALPGDGGDHGDRDGGAAALVGDRLRRVGAAECPGQRHRDGGGDGHRHEPRDGCLDALPRPLVALDRRDERSDVPALRRVPATCLGRRHVRRCDAHRRAPAHAPDHAGADAVARSPLTCECPGQRTVRFRLALHLLPGPCVGWRQR